MAAYSFTNNTLASTIRALINNIGSYFDDTTKSILSDGTGGIGYKTGAGGEVTQGTSKSTGVTISKVSGEITMHNAALAGAAAVSFVVTNALVVATDVIVVNIKSGATANSYTASVSAVGAGQFTIQLHNITAATSLSEAVVLSFAILKAVKS